MTPREGLDRLLRQREEALGLQVGEPPTDRFQGPQPDVTTSLAQLPAGSPCAVMSRQRDAVMKRLANSQRHASVLGPVLQLVRLSQFGHHGLVEVLEDLRGDFIGRVQEERPGGTGEAEQEWTRSVQGALDAVFPKGTGPNPYACCACDISDFRRALRDDRLFTPHGKLAERKVLRYLLARAEYRRSTRVIESQRQVAEAIDIHQPTVCRVLKRLEILGWLAKEGRTSPWSPCSYVLHVPDMVTEVSSTRPAVAPARFLVDTPPTAWVHRLFGPQGLGPGPAETFAVLPEWQLPLGRGRLIRVRPDSQSTTRLRARPATRRLPSARDGSGMTVAELVAATGKSKSTVLRHVKRLAERNLIFSVLGADRQMRWWRYRFDPDVVADDYGIPETSQLKVEKHAVQRRHFYEGLTATMPRPPPSRVIRIVREGRWAYVDVTSGEVLWRDPKPLK